MVPTRRAAAALAHLGGVASRSDVLTLVTRAELERSVRAGEVHRVAWGRYALPTDIEAQRAARELGGVAILVSAAAHWGWARQWEPRRPQVAVKRGRRLDAGVRRRYDVRWRHLPDADVADGWVTAPVRTVVDCAVLLPFGEALAVADSALRSGLVSRQVLLDRVPGLDPQLRPRVRRVVEHADASAANPFESALRDGWLVLRFSWTQVMTRREWVRRVVTRAVSAAGARCRRSTG